MLERIRGKEEKGSGSALVRVHLNLGVEDPFSLLLGESSASEIFAWSDPQGDRCFVALGRASSSTQYGKSRFLQAQDAWAEWARTLHTHEKDELPLAVGGFAFSPRDRGETWNGWSDGLLWVPRLLVQHRAGTTKAAFTAQVGAGDVTQPGEEFEECLGWLRGLGVKAELSSVHCFTAASEDTEDTVQRSAWRKGVEQATAEMARDQLKKVVLARQVDWEAPEHTHFDARATAIALRQRQPDCTVFLVEGFGPGSFVGASPEELVRLTDGRLRTTALAGTRVRSADPAVDIAAGDSLLRSDKDRKEHQLVAETILDTLRPLSSVVEGDGVPVLASYADVHHLRSEFHATLNEGASLFEVLEGLHPTPAVGGLPHQEAMAWLQAHEAMDRGWYAAPVGWVDARGDGVFVVAIRSILIQEREASAFVGCGLVSASVPEAEWNEALAKISTVRQGLVRCSDDK